MNGHSFKLYGTVGCHLCDDAEVVLREAGIEFEYIDIAEDDALVAVYGTRIPVLQRAGAGDELGWPFDAEMAANFVGSACGG